jgi:hypothetical protein
LHERFLDASSPVQELTWIVGPDNQYSTIFDECGELVFLAARQEGDVWKYLES